MGKKLDRDFYSNPDVVFLSRKLIGKSIFTRIDGKLTGGIISETEAYAGITDRASHAFGNRRTNRTEIMYAEGGLAYVYLCYGIHHLFNIVTGRQDEPHAILLRGIRPTVGIRHILRRRQAGVVNDKLTAGPGTASQALGITTEFNGTDLTGNTIWIEDTGLELPGNTILTGPRIGVDYAGEDALLPYRFLLDPSLNL